MFYIYTYHTNHIDCLCRIHTGEMSRPNQDHLTSMISLKDQSVDCRVTRILTHPLITGVHTYSGSNDGRLCFAGVPWSSADALL